jgi:hypothetical protein
MRVTLVEPAISHKKIQNRLINGHGRAKFTAAQPIAISLLPRIFLEPFNGLIEHVYGQSERLWREVQRQARFFPHEIFPAFDAKR